MILFRGWEKLEKYPQNPEKREIAQYQLFHVLSRAHLHWYLFVEDQQPIPSGDETKCPQKEDPWKVLGRKNLAFYLQGGGLTFYPFALKIKKSLDIYYLCIEIILKIQNCLFYFHKKGCTVEDMKSPKEDYEIHKGVVSDPGTGEDLLNFLSFYTLFT